MGTAHKVSHPSQGLEEQQLGLHTATRQVLLYLTEVQLKACSSGVPTIRDYCAMNYFLRGCLQASVHAAVWCPQTGTTVQ
jgi:hypothetical protein